jgi:hypothetical protein
MKITAEALARATRALIVGVGRYAITGTPDLFAAEDARRIASVLTDPAACGIPTANVTALTDERATREQVLAELRRLGQECSESDILFFYFAGHGHRIEEMFLFHLFDTDPKNITGTALSSQDLVAAIAGTRARGVLVVADCCVGAGFAETAPRFFLELERSDFRIALASSRSDQRSWELPADKGSLFTKHLVKILQGEEAVGNRPGEVTYLSLVEALSFQVNEELHSWRPDIPTQELVANGSTVADPLLFVSARAAMKGLTVATGRISRQQLRRMLVRAAVFVGVGMLLGLGLFAGWMKAHQYAEANSDETAVYQGYPGMVGLGYPKLLYRLRLKKEEFRAESPLAKGKPLVAPARADLEARLVGELDALGQAERLLERGKTDSVREIAVAEIRAPKEQNAKMDARWLMALRLLAADKRDLPYVERSLRSEADELRRAALIRLLQLDREKALGFLAADLGAPRTRFDHREVLLQLTAPCTSALRNYLSRFARSHVDLNSQPRLLLVWLHTGCPASIDDVEAMLERQAFDRMEEVGTWASQVGMRDLGAILSNEKLPIASRISFVVGWPGAPCRWDLRDKVGDDILAAVQLARHAQLACEGTEVKAEAGPTDLSVEVRNERLRGKSLSFSIPAPLENLKTVTALAFRSALCLVVGGHLQQVAPFLKTQVLRGENGRIAMPALRALRLLKVPWEPGQGYVRGGNDQGLALDYQLWLAGSGPGEAQRIAFERLGDPLALYDERFYAHIPPEAARLNALFAEVQSGQSWRLEQAAHVVAMYGDLRMLESLAEHPRLEVRESLASYAAFNGQLSAWLATRPHPDEGLRIDRIELDEAAKRRRSLLATVAALPLSTQCWYLAQERESGSERSPVGLSRPIRPGFKLLLEAELARRGCATEELFE